MISSMAEVDSALETVLDSGQATHPASSATIPLAAAPSSFIYCRLLPCSPFHRNVHYQERCEDRKATPPARRQPQPSLQQVLDTFTQSPSFSLILGGAGHPYFNDPWVSLIFLRYHQQCWHCITCRLSDSRCNTYLLHARCPAKNLEVL